MRTSSAVPSSRLEGSVVSASCPAESSCLHFQLQDDCCHPDVRDYSFRASWDCGIVTFLISFFPYVSICLFQISRSFQCVNHSTWDKKLLLSWFHRLDRPSFTTVVPAVIDKRKRSAPYVVVTWMISKWTNHSCKGMLSSDTILIFSFITSNRLSIFSNCPTNSSCISFLPEGNSETHDGKEIDRSTVRSFKSSLKELFRKRTVINQKFPFWPKRWPSQWASNTRCREIGDNPGDDGPLLRTGTESHHNGMYHECLRACALLPWTTRLEALWMNLLRRLQERSAWTGPTVMDTFLLARHAMQSMRSEACRLHCFLDPERVPPNRKALPSVVATVGLRNPGSVKATMCLSMERIKLCRTYWHARDREGQGRPRVPLNCDRLSRRGAINCTGRPLGLEVGRIAMPP